VDTIEFAATFEGDGDTLSGVVHVFGTRTRRGNLFHTFDAGAFDRDIAAGRPMAFYSHDTSKPLAKPSLAIQDRKLTYSMTLGHQSYANDLRENVAAGLMSKMSFGIHPEKWTDEKGADGTITRRHTQSGLFDISPVSIPAFEGTGSLLHSGDVDDRRRLAALARFRVAQEGNAHG